MLHTQHKQTHTRGHSKNIDKMSFNLQVFLFYSLPIIFALLVWKLYFSSKKSHKNLPPSPPRLPLIGNLHQLGVGMHRVLQSMAKTYGPLVLVHFGTVPIIVASSVDAAREIMKTHDITFANRPYLKTMNKVTFDGTDIAFSKYGEQWRQLKSISVLHLLSNKRVQSYRKVREEELASMIKKIQGTNESVFNLSELVATLTHNVISRAALGKIYEGMELKHLLDRTLELLGRFCFANFFPSLAWMDRLTGLERDIEKLAKDTDEFYDVVIDEHVNKKEGDAEGQDLVDILLEIQKDNSTGFRLEKKMIKGVILDLFNAGTDTTFTSLDWAIAELLRNPRAMKKLQQEAHTVGQGREMITEDDLGNMPYLKAVLKETLRLHVPAPLLVPRESTKDVKLLGYDIPLGSQVMINAWAIARDPLIWEESEEFKPERFLNNKMDYKGFDFEYTPFGAGRRGCPAINFAMIINEIVLANLVYKFEFSLPGNEPVDMTESDGLTVHRKFPILVKATPRE
ncbi:putative cytochrome P450 [Helianthus annuus]|nr:putative cytochrome P450 [Helianthus annuus]KAJ0748106.1 putative cytochrome P450 [Helianthus annuus]